MSSESSRVSIDSRIVGTFIVGGVIFGGIPAVLGIGGAVQSYGHLQRDVSLQRTYNTLGETDMAGYLDSTISSDKEDLTTSIIVATPAAFIVVAAACMIGSMEEVKPAKQLALQVPAQTGEA